MSDDDLRHHIASHARTTVRLRARDLLPGCVIEFKGCWYEVMDVATTGNGMDTVMEEIVATAMARTQNTLRQPPVTPQVGVDAVEAKAHLGSDSASPVQVAVHVIDPRLDSTTWDVRDTWLVLPANQLLETQTNPA